MKKIKHYCEVCLEEEGIKRVAQYECDSCECKVCKGCYEGNMGDCFYCEPPRLIKINRSK